MLGYVKATETKRLKLSKVENIRINTFSDASYASDRDDRKSITGYIVMIDKAPIVWKTLKQSCVTLSTMEAEYVAVTEATKETLWLSNVIKECADVNILPDEIPIPTIHVDNMATIRFSETAIENRRSKHIQVRLFFMRDLISTRTIELQHINGTKNIADMLTKCGTKHELLKFCKYVFG